MGGAKGLKLQYSDCQIDQSPTVNMVPSATRLSHLIRTELHKQTCVKAGLDTSDML